jgi:hypothetical protein
MEDQKASRSHSVVTPKSAICFALCLFAVGGCTVEERYDGWALRPAGYSKGHTPASTLSFFVEPATGCIYSKRESEAVIRPLYHPNGKQMGCRDGASSRPPVTSDAVPGTNKETDQ